MFWSFLEFEWKRMARTTKKMLMPSASSAYQEVRNKMLRPEKILNSEI